MDTSSRPPCEGPVFDLGRCRCCGLVTEECRLLNAEYNDSGQKEVYADMMMECYGFTVSGLGGSPTARLVCAACVGRLRAALTFRRQVLRAQDQLRNLLVETHTQEDKCGWQQVDGKLELELKFEVMEECEDPPDWAAGDPHIHDQPPIEPLSENVDLRFNAVTTVKHEDGGTDDRQLQDKTPGERSDLGKDDCKVLLNTPTELITGENIHAYSNNAIPNSNILHTSALLQHVTGESLSRHMRVHDTSRQHACDTCGLRYTTEQGVTGHAGCHSPESGSERRDISKLKHGRLTTEVYSCTQCDYRCAYKSNLNKHVKTHIGKRPFHCEICDKRFTHRGSLRNHLRVHTEVKLYNCTQCDYRSAYKSNLAKHVRTHAGGQPFHCEICDKRFTRRGTLRIHLRVHSGEKPYCCKRCDFSTNYKNSFNEHMSMHTGDRPFHCNICDHKFMSRYKLDTHLLMHNGKKPFGCTLCGYRSVHKHRLNGHMKTHTDEKPFHCEICDKRYKRRDNLRLHLRVHSNEESSSVHAKDINEDMTVL